MRMPRPTPIPKGGCTDIWGGGPLVDWKQKSKRFALDFDYTLAAMETSVMKKKNECVLRQAAAMATN